MSHKSVFTSLLRISAALLVVYLGVAYQMSLWGGAWQDAARVMVAILGGVAGFGACLSAALALIEHGPEHFDKDEDADR